LGSLYPTEFDVVRTELMHWIRIYHRITSSLAAAKFLWCCRMNKILAMFNEVARDFSIPAKKIIQTMLETDYIPALGASEYVDRLSKQLSLADFVRDAAIDLVDDCVGGTSPTVKACCAVLKAAESQGIRLTKGRVASILDVTPVGIHMALKREGSHSYRQLFIGLVMGCQQVANLMISCAAASDRL
jgi:transcription initiation factor TFIIIB Brf1 subunit/transcription initiation factor TFIIB